MEIIAERALTIELPGAESPGTIRVCLGKPEQVGEDEWVAPYEIHGPGPDDVWRAGAHGVDALQALKLSIWALPHELDARIAPLGRLTFHGNDDLGFSDPRAP